MQWHSCWLTQASWRSQQVAGFEADGLPREDRKKLLGCSEAFSAGCDAEATGTVLSDFGGARMQSIFHRLAVAQQKRQARPPASGIFPCMRGPLPAISVRVARQERNPKRGGSWDAARRVIHASRALSSSRRARIPFGPFPRRHGRSPCVPGRDVYRSGGWGGIRTHGTLARTAVFKTAALNRSATHPARADATPAPPSATTGTQA